MRLFSVAYSEENNCTSGIAMFMLGTDYEPSQPKIAVFATIKAIRDIDIPVS